MKIYLKKKRSEADICDIAGCALDGINGTAPGIFSRTLGKKKGESENLENSIRCLIIIIIIFFFRDLLKPIDVIVSFMGGMDYYEILNIYKDL